MHKIINYTEVAPSPWKIHLWIFCTQAQNGSSLYRKRKFSAPGHGESSFGSTRLSLRPNTGNFLSLQRVCTARNAAIGAQCFPAPRFPYVWSGKEKRTKYGVILKLLYDRIYNFNQVCVCLHVCNSVVIWHCDLN